MPEHRLQTAIRNRQSPHDRLAQGLVPLAPADAVLLAQSFHADGDVTHRDDQAGSCSTPIQATAKRPSGGPYLHEVFLDAHGSCPRGRHEGVATLTLRQGLTLLAPR